MTLNLYTKNVFQCRFWDDLLKMLGEISPSLECEPK